MFCSHHVRMGGLDVWVYVSLYALLFHFPLWYSLFITHFYSRFIWQPKKEEKYWNIFANAWLYVRYILIYVWMACMCDCKRGNERATQLKTRLNLTCYKYHPCSRQRNRSRKKKCERVRKRELLNLSTHAHTHLIIRIWKCSTSLFLYHSHTQKTHSERWLDGVLCCAVYAIHSPKMKSTYFI